MCMHKCYTIFHNIIVPPVYMYVYGDCDEGVSVVYMCTHVRVIFWLFPVNGKQFIIIIYNSRFDSCIILQGN
jgi:hypothetical protein